MKPAGIVGIILIIIGIIGLAYGGFTYTKREKVLQIGDFQATTEEHKTLPISPIVAIAAVVGGIALVVTEARTRA